MMFIIITVIVLFLCFYNKIVDRNKFIEETEPYFRFLMEDDYKFLLEVRYGSDIDVNALYGKRVQTGLATILVMFLLFLKNINFITVLFAFIVGYLVFKLQYMKLNRYYKANLNKINLMLPYYLKSLEILVQHYTVPVALRRSIETAPEIFKSGLQELVEKIEAGDSTVQPYMDFAQEYPVRDSMRMMRLLYRLGLGSQENKQEQLQMFSRTVSTLQNKAREQKYKERLEKMEQKTLIMLGVTGGGTLLFMLYAMMSMMNI